MKIKSFKKPSRKNTVLFGKELPEVSFVPFDAFKLKKSSLLWLNKNLAHEMNLDFKTIEKEILDNYSYVSKGYIEKDKLDLSDRKKFLADRYGSRYEVCNGGSARCGINGNFQVKGIGTNPLVSINVDGHHTHGKLGLSEAVNEAIWGEVCNKHLPHGAIRTLAIIDTGCVFESYYGNVATGLVPRTLAIRQVAVRPAHFERATFFLPKLDYQYLRDNDYKRVEESIERMTMANSDGDDIDSVYQLILTFTEKFAEQIAVSRIQGIPHGSLTSSNVCIDGRFVDFGTISAYPDFSNHIIGSEQVGVWDDHVLIVKWIEYIIFFINKYSSNKLSTDKVEHIKNNFVNHLSTMENIELSRVLNLNNHSIKVVQKFKEMLCANGTYNKDFYDYTHEELLKKIAAIAQDLNVNIGQEIEFTLRQKKYSQKYIIDKVMSISSSKEYQRSKVSDFIDSYM